MLLLLLWRLLPANTLRLLLLLLKGAVAAA
jgi:hypothetical protein